MPFKDYSAGDTNRGRFWLGKIGSSGDFRVDVKERPLNTYLGYTANGIETPIAECPLSYNGYSEYESSGTSYMATQRREYTDDLDDDDGSPTIGAIYYTAKMVLLGETGAWHYSAWPTNPWREGGEWHEPGRAVYSLSFVDGHVRNMTIRPSLGITNSSDEIFFRNFE